MMTAATPPETFPLAQESERRPASPLVIRVADVSMIAGAVALVGSALIEMSTGILVATAPWLYLAIGVFERPLLACGQILLVGGAIVARLARRRAARAESGR
ncbi:MAG: hypothetical protein ABIP93_18310 [Gemmatimonadaceae bacterium]